MNALQNMRTYILACIVVVISQPLRGFAQQDSKASSAGPQSVLAQRDGGHDFDFEIGIWKTRLWRLQRPLSGSNTWVEYEGTSVVRKIWNGRANLIELEVDGPAGQIEGLSHILETTQTSKQNQKAKSWNPPLSEPSETHCS